MGRTYVTTIRDRFSAAHTLVGYQGDCGSLHGHTFQVEIKLEYRSLNYLNMTVDFRVIKETFLTPLIERLDHKYLNDVFPTDCPTAEYIAEWFYHQLKDSKYPVKSVIVWESENAGVEYYE